MRAKTCDGDDGCASVTVCCLVVVRRLEWTVAIRRVRSPAPSSGLVGSASSETIRMSPSATSPSGSGRNSTCHSPAALWTGTSGWPRIRSVYFRTNERSVQRVELFCQRSNRLLLQNRNESFEAVVFDRMEVDQVPAGRDGRVPERLEISPHVFEHRDDQIAGGPAVLFHNFASPERQDCMVLAASPREWLRIFQSFRADRENWFWSIRSGFGDEAAFAWW